MSSIKAIAEGGKAVAETATPVRIKGVGGTKVGKKGSITAGIKRASPEIVGTAGRFMKMFLATPSERHTIIQKGLPAHDIVDVATKMDIPRERLYSMLHFPASTVKRKIAQKAVLSPQESARLLGVEKLIGQVEVMIQQSGEMAGFDAAKWVAQWIESPLPALGGDKPGNYLDNEEGLAVVANLLARMQSGGYA